MQNENIEVIEKENMKSLEIHTGENLPDSVVDALFDIDDSVSYLDMVQDNLALIMDDSSYLIEDDKDLDIFYDYIESISYAVEMLKSSILRASNVLDDDTIRTIDLYDEIEEEIINPQTTSMVAATNHMEALTNITKPVIDKSKEVRLNKIETSSVVVDW